MDVNDNINGASTNQKEYIIDPAMKMGHVSPNVSDLSQSLDFYQSVLGFKAVGRLSSGKALLSVGSYDPSYLVELLQVKTGSNNDSLGRLESSTRRAGLYHFAILLPERKFLADMLRNL
jgi:catechol 2,3-dioxygenase